MELAEVARRKDADEQRAQPQRDYVACSLRMESSNLRNEQIPNDCVEESPDNVDRC
jgi:hypothetical protein